MADEDFPRVEYKPPLWTMTPGYPDGHVCEGWYWYQANYQTAPECVYIDAYGWVGFVGETRRARVGELGGRWLGPMEAPPR